MLLLNFIGFAPSYFLKFWTESPALPLRTHIHGIAFSAWFVVLMTQVSLVARRKLRVHMRLGSASMFLAVTMVVLGVIILYYRALEYHSGERDLEGTAMLVWANVAFLTGFAVFVVLGYKYRRQATIHKRAMLLASIAMMPQSLARIGYIPAFQIVDSELNSTLYALGGFLALLAATAVHDRVSVGRVHMVNRVGISALVAGNIASVMFSGTDVGRAIIVALG